MRGNIKTLPRNNKGEFCYTVSKTSARRKLKKINNKRMRRMIKNIE